MGIRVAVFLGSGKTMEVFLLALMTSQDLSGASMLGKKLRRTSPNLND